MFLNVFKDYKDQRENRPSIIREIMSRFTECQKERTFDVVIELSKQENPQVLGFKLHSNNYKESIEFDVQPAFDALGEAGHGCTRDGIFLPDILDHNPWTVFIAFWSSARA